MFKCDNDQNEQEQNEWGKWIPCSERPPEESGFYLVSGNETVWETQFVKVNGSVGGWITDFGNPVIDAWMPLPDGYKKPEVQMEGVKLKPCPFCGSEAVLFHDERTVNSKYDLWYVRCSCGIRTSGVPMGNAIEIWNRRAGDTE